MTSTPKPSAMPAEHARELAIVAMLLTASIAAQALEAVELAASLGGAAVALILPRVPTSARVAVVAIAVGGAMITGCGASTPTVVRGTCAAASVLCAARDHLCREELDRNER